jgi:hypothetical protein
MATKYTLLQERLADEVIAYAEEHYNEDGWDILIETCERREVVTAVGKAKTLKAARRSVRRGLGITLRAEMREEIQSTIW